MDGALLFRTALMHAGKKQTWRTLNMTKNEELVSKRWAASVARVWYTVL